MKNLKKLLTTGLMVSSFFATTVQANDPIANLTYENSSNMFTQVELQETTATGILSYGDDANKTAVWSAEYEQYVSPADFKLGNIDLVNVNQYLDDNPAAAGKNAREVFVYNEVAGEYQLQ
jgi:hypothetical protein